MKKKNIILFICSVLSLKMSFNLFSEKFNANYQSNIFSISPLSESLILTSGVSLFATDIILEKVVKYNVISPSDISINKKDVPLLDSFLMNAYSKPLNYTAYGSLGLLAVSPALFYILPYNEWLTVGFIYAETLLWAEGLKDLGKILVNRARPYMYYDNYPADKVLDNDWSKSWPSGHTTLAFSAASFTSYLFCQYFPESDYRFLVVSSTYALAAVTGALRIASGNHFFSDVISGAILGTSVGLFIPWLHTKACKELFSKNKNSDFAITPTGFAVALRF